MFPEIEGQSKLSVFSRTTGRRKEKKLPRTFDLFSYSERPYRSILNYETPCTISRRRKQHRTSSRVETLSLELSRFSSGYSISNLYLHRVTVTSHSSSSWNLFSQSTWQHRNPCCFSASGCSLASKIFQSVRTFAKFSIEKYSYPVNEFSERIH